MASPATRLTSTTAARAAAIASGMSEAGCHPKVRPQVPVSAVALV
ncbi:hypothetical protein [Streptomyces beijiangensis]|nr:hypothetical protein [Streptomyces beijiangensis]